MRSNWRILAVATTVSWLVPQLAAGEVTEDQVRALNDRMAQMEQKLEATQEELAASQQRVEQQQAVIRDLDADRGAVSALSRFLSETEFSGAVAGSYTYNFRNLESSAVNSNGEQTTEGENLGIHGLTAPYHSNSNTFQVDQLYFRMRKQPTPESRAGWGATIAFGASADALAGRNDSDEATGDLTNLYEAYASYLFDAGEGVNLTAGRYATPVGYESFLVDQNLNVTRGLLYALQPVNHTGAYLRGTLGEAFWWQLGASNSYGNGMADEDTQPAFVGGFGYKADTIRFKLTGVYGGDVEDDFLSPFATFLGGFADSDGVNNDTVMLLDAVLAWDPSESLTTYVNFDMWRTDDYSDTDDLEIYGFAVGGRYGITESTGFALRYEWLYFDEFFGFDGTLMEVTGTLDHRLTDNLVLSAEARWDRGDVEGFPNWIYLQNNGDAFDLDFSNDDQILGVVQLRYEF